MCTHTYTVLSRTRTEVQQVLYIVIGWSTVYLPIWTYLINNLFYTWVFDCFVYSIQYDILQNPHQKNVCTCRVYPKIDEWQLILIKLTFKSVFDPGFTPLQSIFEAMFSPGHRHLETQL